MKKEQLSKLINSHKRVDTIETPKKKRLSVTLWKYTGRSIVKTIETYMSDLKNDLDIVFKPVKNFTKKHLKGVDSTTLHDISNENLKKEEHMSQSTTQPLQKKEEFINWFDVDENRAEPKKEKKTRITLEKADGTIVGLGTIEDVF